jgi:hypothetical protein
MESGNGSQQLTRLAAAYATSIAFGLTFLIASLSGADLGTTLVRSVVAGLAALIASHLLAAPVVDVVLAAMARDEAKRQGDKPKEEA